MVHTRYQADVNDALDNVDHYAAMQDNRGFVQAVQQALRSFQLELNGVGQCFDEHATTLESHHESFWNAFKTFKEIRAEIATIKTRSDKMEAELSLT